MLSDLRTRPRLVAGLIAVLLVVTVAAGAGVMTILGQATTAPAVARLRTAAEQRPLGPTDQLIFETQSRIAVNPEDAEGHTLLGTAYLQLARETADPANYAKAEAALDRALELAPDNVEALVGRGSLALSRHEFEAALRLGEQAVAINATIPRVYGLIGDAQVELGRYEEAVVSIQTMVDLRPDLASYSRVSYLRELHGDLDGAIDAMQRAVSAGGGNEENTEYVRVQLGNLYFAAGDLAAAERAYAESLAHRADYPYALAGMARVRAAQGDLTEAIDLYERASANIPAPEFVIALGEALEAAGRRDEAADQYALVEAIGQLLEANGVRSDLEIAAFLAEHGRDPETAVARARGALEVRPTIVAADTLAWALHAAGKDDEAAEHADRALRLDTSSSLMLYHAGVIAAANGETDLARSRLERALELNPHFSPLFAPRAEAVLSELDAAK